MKRSDFFKRIIGGAIAVAVAPEVLAAACEPTPSYPNYIIGVDPIDLPYKNFGIFIPQGNGTFRVVREGGVVEYIDLRWKDGRRFDRVEAVKVNG